MERLEDSIENYSSCRVHDVIRGGGRGEGTAALGALTPLSYSWAASEPGRAHIAFRFTTKIIVPALNYW